MHVVLAPDKFKGSLTAAEVATHLAAGLRSAVPGLDVREVPVADGGDGTLDAVVANGFRHVPVRATGPTGEPVDTGYAVRDGVAVVELADVSGLRRLPGAVLDPLHATSYGTGEVVRAALDAGVRTVVLGLGGSACTDGGAGMVQALGARLLDAEGRDLPPGGAALSTVDRVELDGLHPGVRTTEIVVASDVDNPLLGANGAAAVYGPQKGATPTQVRLLDNALARWATAVHRVSTVDGANLPGAGAAGGVGFAALTVLRARVRPGIGYLLDVLEFGKHLAGARLVVTGEGSLDEQTLRGKAPAGVAEAAAGVPVVAVAGRIEVAHVDLFAAMYALTDIEPDVRRCMTEAGPLLERLAAERLAKHLEVSP
ncbi:glycerate kinase [Herbihabitans rhizosphaerae]|uniref:Glycerate kinase n=1 Tax=Herbihabitans rhizosphaerae TaxID=1872711 RepID=A0A4Q7KJK1_9PSEU|nr:glycerate kinase [Herbihabitans rhizosphaerae]RZS36364.1 glycerate kinase [Herbihabitans rhizosphaerae]